jgi:hypothetical protein
MNERDRRRWREFWKLTLDRDMTDEQADSLTTAAFLLGAALMPGPDSSWWPLVRVVRYFQEERRCIARRLGLHG